MTTVASGDPSWAPGSDAAVRSACELCLNHCGILVHRSRGEVVGVEGDPDNPLNQGRICAKGNAGYLYRYSSIRIRSPLKRGNPRKGLGEDPQWQPIGWDEAISLVAERLRQTRTKDPRLVYVTSFDPWTLGDVVIPWCLGFGTEARPFSSGFYCGNNVHNIHLATEAAFEADPDAGLTRYLLLFGSQYGAAVNYDVMYASRQIATKRPGGIKVVVVDPVGASYAAGRAEEWIPIRPGTDTALALSFIDLLVNEYHLFDEPFLKARTNAPYLVGADERYVRDPETGKPLVWDAGAGGPRPWDSAGEDLAIEGTYSLDGGRECRPAFQILRDHVRSYDPDGVSRITTVPAKTIRRVAREFGEAARIGETIEIKGKRLPYRPASIAYYRGLSAHKHSMLAGLAVETLQVIIGGIDVPGGLLATEPANFTTDKDGLLAFAPARGARYWAYYPPRRVVDPLSVDLLELFPVAVYSRPFFILGVLFPEVYKTPYIPEVMISIRTNFMKSSVDPEVVSRFLQRIPFMVTFALEPDETCDFADIVFPDLHYLERLSLGKSWRQEREGLRPWFFYGQKPAVRPPFDPPRDGMVNTGEIFLEIAERAGFLDDVYSAINSSWNLAGPYRLEPGKGRYTFSELADRRLKSNLGPDRGLGWYLGDGLLVADRPVERMYRGPFSSARVHVYFEFMQRAGEEVRAVTDRLGIPWDTSDYQVLPDWKPCAAHQRGDRFDLTLVNYKAPQLSFSFTHSNPVMRELARRIRLDDVIMNSETAVKRGIKDGDTVSIETAYGKMVKATVRTTELVHPEVVACHGGGGRFSRGTQKHGNDAGINFNSLVSMDMGNIDYVSAALDSHIPVCVSRVP